MDAKAVAVNEGFENSTTEKEIAGKLSGSSFVVTRHLGYQIIKRSADIVLSALALIILSPVFLITAIAIKMEDGGNCIFRQERSGWNGEVFSMYKFRSMVVDAPSLHQEMLKHNP